MGLLVDGKWQDRWYDTGKSAGRFVREESQFRHWLTPDGRPGPEGRKGYPAAPGRYRLYVSLACPWAHRILIIRVLKGLEAMIPVSIVHWRMLDQGWTFEDGPGVVPDPEIRARYLYQLYLAADPGHSGRVTVPLLWDTEERTIVNNESSELLRMLGDAFDDLGARAGDFYPSDLREEIDALNDRIYRDVNNGVYRAGFATTQAAYEEAIGPLFLTLDWLEARLSGQPWLCGDRLTEADLRLFTTLIRFDAVYVGHFKCNLRRIVDYPALSAFLHRLYKLPGVAGTVNFRHIKGHYYESHRMINPTGIVPAGPILDLDPSPAG